MKRSVFRGTHSASCTHRYRRICYVRHSSLSRDLASRLKDSIKDITIGHLPFRYKEEITDSEDYSWFILLVVSLPPRIRIKDHRSVPWHLESLPNSFNWIFHSFLWALLFRSGLQVIGPFLWYDSSSGLSFFWDTLRGAICEWCRFWAISWYGCFFGW